MRENMDKIIISQIQLSDAKLTDVLAYLQETSIKADPDKKDIPFEIHLSPNANGELGNITLDLKNISVHQALSFLKRLILFEYIVKEDRIYISNTISMCAKVHSFAVSPYFFINIDRDKDIVDVTQPLKDKGVKLADGDFAIYFPKHNELLVRNGNADEGVFELIHQLLMPEY